MISTAPLPATAASQVRQVLERVLVAVEAFWLANLMLTKYAVGVTQRVMRLQDGVDALAARFEGGLLRPWRRRPVRRAMAARPVAAPVLVEPAKAQAVAEAAADAAAQRAAAPPIPRKPVYAVPAYYGWLADQMRNSSGPLAYDLHAAFSTEKMRALMLTTPEVARMARPVFRMLRIDESVLLVPDGYTGRACGSNHRYVAPDPKPVSRRSDYVPKLVVPEDYVEARDGRQSHPLRYPDWDYKAFEDYRLYLYYYIGRKPNWIRPPP